MNFLLVEKILERIRPGSRILLHSACAEPQTLVEALIAGIRAGEPNLYNLTVYALTYRAAGAPTPLYAAPDLLQSGQLHLKSFFPHPALKEASRQGLVDYVPVSLSNLPGLLRKGYIRPDWAFLQVSQPNEFDMCSFGPAGDLPEAILEAGIPVIAEMNRRMPFVFGPLAAPESFAAIIESDRPLLEVPPLVAGATEKQVAANVAELIPDRAAVQLGVGTIPEALVEFLKVRRHLGLHGGALSDGLVDLYEAGAVTNEFKPLSNGKTVSSLLIGTRRLFDFAHQNQLLELQPIDRCNHPAIIAQIPGFISVNSALEVDYWGQVNAETIGDWQLAGVGGQLDYVTGTWYGQDALSIIALPSATGSGKPRIVPRLAAGATITTPRHMAQVIVTEKGVADLRGKSLTEREKILRSIS